MSNRNPDVDMWLASADDQIQQRLHVGGGVTVIAFSDDGDRVAGIGTTPPRGR